MNNYPAVFDEIRTENWIVATTDQRRQYLQDFEDYEAIEQGRKARTIVPVNMGNANYCGNYDPDSPDTIQINEEHLSDDLANQGFNYECLDTVLHEGRHAYQDDAINGKIEHNPEETELWRMNSTDGIYKTQDQATYRFQPLEADANNFAHSEIDQIKSQVGEDLGYDKYIEGREYSDELAAKSAEARYGENYEAEIEKSVREQYSEKQQVQQTSVDKLNNLSILESSNIQDSLKEQEEDYSYGYGL